MLLAALFASPSLCAWPSLELEPVQDNTLYETPIDSGATQYELSNGAGDFLFAGRGGMDAGFKLRRAVLKFDLSGLPAGAEILAARLTLHQSRAAPGSPPASMGLYRVSQDWGEGESEGIGAEGQGNFATAGDATWHHRFYPDIAWDTPGGSFAETASATTTVGQELTAYTWGCTSALVADLALWQSAPAQNFGWIVVGGEAAAYSAHRFDSRENEAVETRPRLTIVYRPAETVHSDGFETPPDCG
jgi:hypothetical protein